jgi:hypothetical protein
MTATARAAAQAALGRKPVGDIRPRDFSLAEARAARDAQKASRSGDIETAIQKTRERILHHHLAREAANAKAEVKKAETFWRKFNGKDEKLAPYRDIDLVNVGRDLLATIKFRPIDEQQRELVANSLGRVRENHPLVFEAVAGVKVSVSNLTNRSMTWEQFQELADTLKELWSMSRREKLIEIEGRQFEMGEVVNGAGGFVPQILSLGDRKFANTLGAGPVDSLTVPLFRRAARNFWQWEAGLKRPQHWMEFMDGGSADGPFHRYAALPLFRAAARLLVARQQIYGRLRVKLKAAKRAVGRKWDIRIPTLREEGMLDSRGNPIVLRGMQDLMGLMLDMGNLSNLEKRLVGEGWALPPRETDGILVTTGWDRFWARMEREGRVPAEAAEFVRSVWREFDQLLPLGQETHKTIYGYEFEAVDILEEVRLPDGSVGRGGYAPLRYDPHRARSQREDSQIHSIEGQEGSFQYSVRKIGGTPTTGKGFTLPRNPNYYERMYVDVGSRLAGIDEELRFIFLQPQIKNVMRITKNPDFKAAMEGYDIDAINGILHPWLDNTARQSVTRPSESRFLDGLASVMTGGTAMIYLAGNFVTAAIQGTGAVNTLAALGPKWFLAGVTAYVKSPWGAWHEAANRSVVARERMKTEAEATRQFLFRHNRGPFWRTFDTFKDWSRRVAWSPLRLVQSQVDVMAWHGAYQRAKTEGKTEEDAVTLADLMMEKAQGGRRPETAAKFESTDPIKRSMYLFLSYSNVVLNQILGGRTATQRFGRFVGLVSMIAVMDTALRWLVSQNIDDEDDDGILNDIAEEVVKNWGRNATSLVPIFGPAALAAMEGETDRLNASPVVATLQQVARGVEALTTGDVSTGYRVQSVGAMLTLATGLPIMPLARSAGVAVDVFAGRVDPTSDADLVRALITGRASAASRR